MAIKLETIKKRSSFNYVRQNGNFIKGDFISIQFFEDNKLNEIIAVGYITTKKLGNAVKRNKAKRLMRELARKVILKYGKKNSYYVLIAKNSIFTTTFKMLEIELKKLVS